MKSYKISDEFSGLKEFTLSLPHTFDHIGLTIHSSRNVVKKIITKEGTFVVKNFKGMYFFNRLAYSLFRKSKAVRSYNYSKILNDNGIITPPHVAWIDCYTLGLLTRSYFVSVYFPYKTLEQVLEYNDRYDGSYKVSLYRHLAAFAIKLHNLGIYHKDFSLGNILVMQTLDSYQFALVDLNRMKFQKVSYKKGFQNFSTLGLPPEDMNMLIREYAIQSGRSPEDSVYMFWIYNNRTQFLRSLKRRIRHYTIARLERILDRSFF